MKKLIKLSTTHYIVVDDSEIKKGDLLRWSKDLNVGQQVDSIDRDWSEWKKITHSTEPELLDSGWMQSVLPLLLSEVEEAINGYDLIALSMNATSKNKFAHGRHEEVVAQIYYRRGFKAHKELVKDKLFTVEDMFDAVNMVINEPDMSGDDIIKSLLPKTEWEVEFDQCGKIIILNT